MYVDSAKALDMQGTEAMWYVELIRMYFSGRVHVGFNFRRNEQFIFTVNRLYA